jgi:hypothetical protein
MARRGPAAILAAALARGAISERRADELSRAVAAGQDITWLDGVTGTRGAAPDPAAIGVNASSAAAPGELSDDEADALWPARSEAEAQRRFRAAEAAASARLRELPDDALYEQLFASTGLGHEAYDIERRRTIHNLQTGSHSHPHAAYGSAGDDATHDHSHTHNGDANHDHEHG